MIIISKSSTKLKSGWVVDVAILKSVDTDSLGNVFCFLCFYVSHHMKNGNRNVRDGEKSGTQ